MFGAVVTTNSVSSGFSPAVVCSFPDSVSVPFATVLSTLIPLPCTAEFPACFVISISNTLSESFAPFSSSEVLVSNPDFPLSTAVVPLSDADFPLSNPDVSFSTASVPLSDADFPLSNPDFSPIDTDFAFE